MNQLIHGDNFDILKGIETESVDLIYLDPPFFSNRSYEVIWGDKGEVRSFEDRWSGGVDKYIDWLYERVEAMYSVLKPTGSIFLHCDWHANAYIRVYVLDKLFGRDNFRNEIIWKRTNTPKGSQFANKQFGVAADSIFFYSKSKTYTFNDKIIRTQLTQEELKEKYPKTDDNGRYYEYPILRSASKGERPNLVYEYKGFTPPSYGWVVNKEKLTHIDERGDLGWKPNGQPFRKFRPSEDPGVIFSNIWDDILRIQSNAKERIGYPTQKPEALLERIIKCASSEGGLVLDPFMGGGTTIAVADKLNRRWIGIDQSAVAVKVTQMRLQRHQWVTSAPYSVELQKYDYETLRQMDAFEFESFIINKFGGTPHGKKGGDMGIDGRAAQAEINGRHADGAPIQVKRSESITRDVIDKFLSAAKRHNRRLFDKNLAAKRPAGYIIAFSFGKGIVQEAARLKNEEGVIIRLVRVDEIIAFASKPMARLDFNEISTDKLGNREIELVAAGQSECGVSAYFWDLEYAPDRGFKGDMSFDKKGRLLHTFSAGVFRIAAKVVDNEGQECIVDKTLVVNGGVKWMDGN